MVTSRVVRTLLTLLLSVVVWVGYVKAAQAAAPLCDKRGATTFAPAPQLQAPEASIDLGLPIYDVTESWDHAQKSGQEDSRIHDFEGSDPAWIGPMNVTVSAPTEVGLSPGEDDGFPRTSVSSRIERPPRSR